MKMEIKSLKLKKANDDLGKGKNTFLFTVTPTKVEQ